LYSGKKFTYHLETAEIPKPLEVTGIAVAVTGQEMVVNDQPIRVGGNEPAFQRHAVHRPEEHVLVLQADVVGAPINRSPLPVRPELDHRVDDLARCYCTHGLRGDVCLCVTHRVTHFLPGSMTFG
jgi:hypothetical protein